jgi:hypothetical protein
LTYNDFFRFGDSKSLRLFIKHLFFGVHYQCKPSPNIITKYGFSSNKTPIALTLECNIHSFFLLVKKNYEKIVGGEHPKVDSIYIDHNF